jgi:hypothetical protein
MLPPNYEQPQVDDITMALWLVDHELRVDDIFDCDPAMPRPSLYVLSVMLCNYGSRFVAFYKSSASVNTWIIYADGHAATCGDWSSVFERCRRDLLQPFVILYEKPPLVPCDVCQAPLAPRMGVRLTVRGAHERICSSCMTTIARSLGVGALARASSVVVGGAVLTRQRRRQLEPCSQCGDAVRTAFVDDTAGGTGRGWLCTRCVLARVIPTGALRGVPRLMVTGAPVAAAASMRGDDAPAPTGEYLHLPSRPAGVESPRTSGGAESLAMRLAADEQQQQQQQHQQEQQEQQRLRRPRRGTAGDVPLTANVYGDLPRPAARRTPYWLRRRVGMADVQYVGACNECGADLIFQPDELMPVSVTCAACSHVTVFAPISAVEPALPVTARPLPQAPVSVAVVGADDERDSDSRAGSKKNRDVAAATAAAAAAAADGNVALRNSLTCVYCNALLVSPADDPLAANGACAVCEWRRELAAVLEDDPYDSHHGGTFIGNGAPQHQHQQQQQQQHQHPQQRNPRGGAYHELPRSAYAALSTNRQQPQQPFPQNIYQPLDRVVPGGGGDFRALEEALVKAFDDAFAI